VKWFSRSEVKCLRHIIQLRECYDASGVHFDCVVSRCACVPVTAHTGLISPTQFYVLTHRLSEKYLTGHVSRDDVAKDRHTLPVFHRRSQGVHWVHLHPQGRKKLGGGRNFQEKVVSVPQEKSAPPRQS